MSTLTDRTTPVAAEPTGAGDVRRVAVRVNLLPDEIVCGRRTDVLRRQVLTGLAALVAVLVLGYGFSWWQTHSAHNDLESAQAAQSSLQKQSRAYAPLVAAKTTTSTIQTRLRELMAGDVTWNDMLRTLRATAPRGVSITTIDGTVTAGAAGVSPGTSATTPDVLNQTGLQQIGTMTLTGTAPDKNRVADYADALSRIRGLAAASVPNVATADGRVSWTIGVTLTTGALGKPYQLPTSLGGN